MNTLETIALLRSTLDGVAAAVSAWDRQGRNRFSNKAFLAWFGVTQEAVAGRHLRDVMGLLWFERLEAAMAAALAGDGSQLEAALPDRDGVSRARVLTVAPDHGADGVRGLVITATLPIDASDAFARQAALGAERQRREASELASKAKSDFLASMSHEIRTPMNAILGLSYLALQQSLDDTPREYIQKVHRAAENLLGVLNGILDFSKVEAGEMQLAHEPFRLDDVLDRVMETAGVKAQDKRLKFTLEIEPHIPMLLVGDALRLGQVLLNLCDNAIKFTRSGGQVLVQVESMLQLGKRIELIFSVADTGVGVPSDKQIHIFRKFAQADASTARSHGGTGLGLSICRQLVQLMGGQIGLQSQVGSGSTFHFNALFDVVAAVADDNATDPKPTYRASAPLPAPHGAKVLLAEDNEVNQLVACEILRRVGIEVLVADNGRQALEMLTAHPDVDLVLMDCYMPVMDGFAATRAIRAQPRFHDLPVLAMTANVLPDDLLKCRGVGMNDFVGKPFHVHELYQMLSRWLGPERPGAGPRRARHTSFN